MLDEVPVADVAAAGRRQGPGADDHAFGVVLLGDEEEFSAQQALQRRRQAVQQLVEQVPWLQLLQRHQTPRHAALPRVREHLPPQPALALPTAAAGQRPLAQFQPAQFEQEQGVQAQPP